MNPTPSQVAEANLLNGITTQQLAVLTGVLGGQHSFNQGHLSTLTMPGMCGGVGITNVFNGGIIAVSQQQLAPSIQPPVAVESKSTINATAQSDTGSASDISVSSLPWPVVSPILNVPYFDLPSYRLVNLDVAPSRDINGFDLPLADVTTLRFFFNLGVQHSRCLATSQLYQERLVHDGGVPALSTNFGQTPQANLPTVTQLGAVNFVPTNSQVCGSRTGDQYLSQFGIVAPQIQALIRHVQSHNILQQGQTVAAPSARLTDRHYVNLANSAIPLNADILAMATQLPISHSTSTTPPQLSRQPITSNGSAPPMASNAAASILNSKQMQSNPAAAEQQAYYLQQALSVVANAQTDKSDMQMHMLQQQENGAALQAFFRPSPEEALQPMAVVGGSGDAAVSPRPPPVDPCPPRIRTDATSNISDGPSLNRVHQQNDESSSTPILTTDDVVPVSQTLFQVSEQHFTEAFNASRKKNIVNPIAAVRKDNINTTDNGAISENSLLRHSHGVDKRDIDDRPALAPILMMTYLSNCMNNIKSTLSTNGVPVGLDANGRAVDYSSRPIDPIFQQARVRMENAREFREISPPTAISQLGPRCTANDDASSNPPIGITSKTSPSSNARIKSTNNSLNKIATDASTVERVESDVADSGSPVEKRIRVISEGD